MIKNSYDPRKRNGFFCIDSRLNWRNNVKLPKIVSFFKFVSSRSTFNKETSRRLKMTDARKKTLM